MLENLLALIAATLVLVAIPGPNVALIVANSLKHGAGYGLATVAGTTLGVGLQLLLVVFGLSALLTATAGVLLWVKWLGIIYLVYLGIKSLLNSNPNLNHVVADDRANKHAVRDGLLLAVINPKTLLFNAAFIPQFVSGTHATDIQLLVVASVFLFTLMMGDCIWVLFAASLRKFMVRVSHVCQYLSGLVYLAAGFGLALLKEK